MSRFLTALGGLLTSVWISCIQAEDWVVLEIAGHALKAELAETLEQRRQGLMGRAHLPMDQGMLFVFEDEARRCLWMKNTPLPLSAAFLDAQGQIINIVDLHPHEERPRCSTAPARFALEVSQGWFEQHSVSVPMQVKGLPTLKN